MLSIGQLPQELLQKIFTHLYPRIVEAFYSEAQLFVGLELVDKHFYSVLWRMISEVRVTIPRLPAELQNDSIFEAVHSFEEAINKCNDESTKHMVGALQNIVGRNIPRFSIKCAWECPAFLPKIIFTGLKQNSLTAFGYSVRGDFRGLAALKSQINIKFLSIGMIESIGVEQLDLSTYYPNLEQLTIGGHARRFASKIAPMISYPSSLQSLEVKDCSVSNILFSSQLASIKIGRCANVKIYDPWMQ